MEGSAVTSVVEARQVRMARVDLNCIVAVLLLLRLFVVTLIVLNDVDF